MTPNGEMESRPVEPLHPNAPESALLVLTLFCFVLFEWSCLGYCTPCAKTLSIWNLSHDGTMHPLTLSSNSRQQSSSRR